MASATSASARAVVSASDFFEHCEAFTSGHLLCHENKMRTSSQWGRRNVGPAALARLTRVNHASIRNTIFLRATEPLKLRKGHCSRDVRTQPFGQYTEIRIDVISRPAILTWRNSHGRTWQSPSRML